jgi:hypothetical protein
LFSKHFQNTNNFVINQGALTASKIKQQQKESNMAVTSYSNMMSFFRCVNKPAIYLDGKISLAHALCQHLSQVINL